eukprot:CAMPEP_0197671722 /NCGR_PEP_ID=MMETSP1338-20131121/77317_1 /TAXON_ID=43686 ORGANISM="Pelagodinium beii, Strain RCC1491" /NCGR_SAMPLE_ID=MMETSP1338 /ASSEMBLY_ACC=CAM_ASM_000754 /LENGTH=82 /DNA_ID=CAMNT_0043251683 /DNA_START=59 /DNA_END=304 /DNA_ORIENTATION=-
MKGMEDAGLSSHELVPQAKQAQELLLRRYQQRCENAVCAVQAALEAPRDDRFGDVVREALQSAEDAHQAKGGALACEEARRA